MTKLFAVAALFASCAVAEEVAAPAADAAVPAAECAADQVKNEAGECVAKA